MPTFSRTQSYDGRFSLKLEFSPEDKPLKLFIEVVEPKNRSVTISDLARVIHSQCFGIGYNSFGLDKNTTGFPCEVRHGMECRDINISWFNSYYELLAHIASQISI